MSIYVTELKGWADAMMERIPIGIVISAFWYDTYHDTLIEKILSEIEHYGT